MEDLHDWVVYSRDDDAVADAIVRGDFDHIHESQIGILDELFFFIQEEGILPALAASYPSPRERHAIPVGLLLGAALALALSKDNAYLGLNAVLQSATLLAGLGLNVGSRFTRRSEDKRNDSTPRRTTPFDQDTVRKYFKDTPAARLTEWFNRDVVGLLFDRGFYDPDGIAILDGSHLPLPDNEAYEDSAVISLTRDGKRPREGETALPTRCRQIVHLLNVSPTKDYFASMGFRVRPGNEDETAIARPLVATVLDARPQALRLLLMDREFLDGPWLRHLWQDRHVAWVIPLRTNMILYRDATALADEPDAAWVQEEVPLHRRRDVRSRRCLGLDGFTTWDALAMPVNVVVVEEVPHEGDTQRWVLATPLPAAADPARIDRLYTLRDAVEERHRQWKQSWKCGRHHSTSIHTATAQTAMMLLAYSLFQFYLNTKRESEQGRRLLQTLKREERSRGYTLVVYAGRRFSLIPALALLRVALEWPEDAKAKVRACLDRILSREPRIEYVLPPELLARMLASAAGLAPPTG